MGVERDFDLKNLKRGFIRKMYLEKALEILSKELELVAASQKDKEGIYRLKLFNDIEIHISELNPGAYFFSNIGLVPKEKGKEVFYIYLMKANFMGQGTGGATIGMDPDEKYLTLSQGLPFEFNYDLFKETLEDFVNYLIFWQAEIVRLNQTIL